MTTLRSIEHKKQCAADMSDFGLPIYMLAGELLGLSHAVAEGRSCFEARPTYPGVSEAPFGSMKIEAAALQTWCEGDVAAAMHMSWDEAYALQRAAGADVREDEGGVRGGWRPGNSPCSAEEALTL